MRVDRLENLILRYYNRVCGCQVDCIDQIPPETLDFLLNHGYEGLIRPFVIEDLRKGKGRRHLANIYGITTRKVRTLRNKIK